ncbi:P-loop containing nucleoside triphosphate hydrolase protein [Lactarius psammicola]|nr:P-loop containing nucleoside triphosphate hydrolase protein [Lactarius psammicola]
MHAVVKDCFGFFPCKWQLEAALTQLEKRDLVTLAPTGSGKTLTFWIPLLFNGDGITIVITPLNILGNKNVVELSAISISAINLTMASASEITFKDIESLKYRVIITSSKCVLTDWKFLELWKSMRFVKKLRSFVFDEAHCISQWSGEFHLEYADVGRLRWLLPNHVVFHMVSATLPSHILGHIRSILQMRLDKTREIRLSNDRPNIHLLTLEMLDPVHSCYDILRVLRFDGDPPPPLFMVFCNDWRETDTKFQTEMIKKLHSHEIWGIFCTDAAGMGLDLRDVKLIVQWKYTQSLCMLWQRLGRAARDSSKEATGVYIVEPQYMDHHRIQAGQRAASRTDKAQKRRLQDTSDTENVTLQGQVRMGDKRVGLCVCKKPRHQRNLAGLELGAGVPRAMRKLIVQEERHQNYEAAAMEAYINACP